jgi:hypothetical protein
MHSSVLLLKLKSQDLQKSEKSHATDVNAQQFNMREFTHTAIQPLLPNLLKNTKSMSFDISNCIRMLPVGAASVERQQEEGSINEKEATKHEASPT